LNRKQPHHARGRVKAKTAQRRLRTAGQLEAERQFVCLPALQSITYPGSYFWLTRVCQEDFKKYDRTDDKKPNGEPLFEQRDPKRKSYWLMGRAGADMLARSKHPVQVYTPMCVLSCLQWTQGCYLWNGSARRWAASSGALDADDEKTAEDVSPDHWWLAHLEPAG
jgi:hypothetical protein